MNVLDEAAQLIDGERQDQYGDASESHQRIADLWASYLGTDVTEFDVVNMMILLKVSRTRNQYHRDSYVDIAGYSALGERLYQTAAGTGVPVDFDTEWALPDFSFEPDLHVEGFEDIFIPNVWKSLKDIPDRVLVADGEGDFWRRKGNDIYLWFRDEAEAEGGATDPDDWDRDSEWSGPFTEVLEA